MSTQQSASPRINVWGHTDSAWGTKSSDPGTIVGFAAFGTDINDSVIALAHAGSIVLTAYPFSAGVIGTKFADPGTPPVGTGQGVAFTH